MKNFFFLIIPLVLITACNSAKKDLAVEIETLENAVETNPTLDNTRQLLQKYEEYIEQFPGDQEWSGRYLYRSAAVAYRARNYPKAMTQLDEVVAEFPASSAAPLAILMKASILDENLMNEKEAGVAYQYFLDHYPDHPEKATAEFFFKPPKEKLSVQIAELESQIYVNEAQNQINPQVFSLLRRKYREYSEKVKDDPEGSVVHLMSLADLMAKTSNYAGAVQNLEMAISKFPEAQNIGEAYLMLAAIYEDDLNDEAKSKQTARDFLSKFPDNAKAEEAKYYLKPISEKLEIRIADLEAAIYQDTSGARIDPRKANQLINKYEKYSEVKPKAAETPNYLYKAGELARSIRNFPKALELWEKVTKSYASFDKAPQALFLQGFTHENDYRNLPKAEELYKKFLKDYPKHDLADDVQFSLNFLGKSPDEIIKNFEEKADSSSLQ